MQKLKEHYMRLRSDDRAGLLYSLILALIFGTLFLVTVIYFLTEARRATSTIIYEQTQKLVESVKKIDKDCTILSMHGSKVFLNFLNVVSFVGSEVGSVNLAHPKNWQGPYLRENPTIQGKYYYMLTTPTGHYIVPGDGVVLSDGKILGRDILINANTDIPALLKNEKGLKLENQSLIAEVPLTKMPILSSSIQASNLISSLNS